MPTTFKRTIESVEVLPDVAIVLKIRKILRTSHYIEPLSVMNCQKCRTPLKLDISLQDLNPAAFDLLVGLLFLYLSF